ncbi:Mitochondrial distribution and morphology protein 12 [Golovinomyces cichoracearum]|uniref:Mitochondrial distribution and morphology protein 12 n=1 Tax=Golovinomyces cichoracearum TaxID=62708 RepID=A0A420IXZ9_9PEZI|nr:Mitochondrial distribution and morphology protein 12 [Golovinomyces cichoracearum]
MSIDINWTTLTAGPDGIALADKIRDFFHDKFQTAPLPRFIQSVKVQDFDFGSIAPEVEIMDICDPLPDFYEEIENYGSESGEETRDDEITQEDLLQNNLRKGKGDKQNAEKLDDTSSGIEIRPTNLGSVQLSGEIGYPLGSSTPGIPGGTSNLSYFHTQLANGLSGSRTPLAAVAGAHLYNGWPEYYKFSNGKGNWYMRSEDSSLPQPTAALELGDNTDCSATTKSVNETKPSTRDGLIAEETHELKPSPQFRFRKPRIQDIQTVFRVRYAGDVKISLTVDILLDYPMPSFVGIPIQLRITGLTFDGLAVLASIRKRAHFCFLSPEDALTAYGNESAEETRVNKLKMNSILQEIKVESEIGKREYGKQVLKNVGKVEKFVLEQVRRIFEDELVYPSFWTFLI